MKTKTIYICQSCKREYETSGEAWECEARCLGLTIDEYREYISLLTKERNAAGIVSITKNQETEKLFDDCIKGVIEFQRKHGIEDKEVRV